MAGLRCIGSTSDSPRHLVNALPLTGATTPHIRKFDRCPDFTTLEVDCSVA
jgi:hypothetical protein